MSGLRRMAASCGRRAFAAAMLAAAAMLGGCTPAEVQPPLASKDDCAIRLGCASARNLTALAADPRDLAGPREEGPRDAQQRDMLLAAWRSGQAAQTDDRAGGASQRGDIQP